MKHFKPGVTILLTLLVAMILGVGVVARADVAVPNPRPPRPSPQAPANNGNLFITVKDGVTPAQLELPRAMTRRGNQRTDAASSGSPLRLAMIAGAGTAGLLFVGGMGLIATGRLRSGRTVLVLIAAGISLTLGASVGLANKAVSPRPEEPAEAPSAPVDGPAIVVRATEDAPAVTLTVSPKVLRKAIADAEAAKGSDKK